jgi:hypothetical protein
MAVAGQVDEVQLVRRGEAVGAGQEDRPVEPDPRMEQDDGRPGAQLPYEEVGRQVP